MRDAPTFVQETSLGLLLGGVTFGLAAVALAGFLAVYVPLALVAGLMTPTWAIVTTWAVWTVVGTVACYYALGKADIAEGPDDG